MSSTLSTIKAYNFLKAWYVQHLKNNHARLERPLIPSQPGSLHRSSTQTIGGLLLRSSSLTMEVSTMKMEVSFPFSRSLSLPASSSPPSGPGDPPGGRAAPASHCQGQQRRLGQIFQSGYTSNLKKRGFLDSESIGACYELYPCTFYNLCYW